MALGLHARCRCLLRNGNTTQAGHGDLHSLLSGVEDPRAGPSGCGKTAKFIQRFRN